MNIEEFASRIGVSRTTVSSVISGRGRVSEGTRRMVLERMGEIGYVPNLHAQQLATGRSNMVLLHSTGFDFLSNQWVVEVARGIQAALLEVGCGLLLDTASSLEDKGSMLHRWIDSRAIDGVVLVCGPTYDLSGIEQLAGPQTPFVVMGGPSVSGIAHVGSVVYSHDSGLGSLAGEYLRLGHSRVGYIGWSPDVVFSSFRHAVRGLGMELADDLVAQTRVMANSPEEGSDAMARLLALPHPPTAVFARVEPLALGAIREVQRRGLSVPDDISIAAHDDVLLARYTDPPLTTIRMDCLQLGKSAIALLQRLREEPDFVQPPVMVDATSLVVRETVGPSAV